MPSRKCYRFLAAALVVFGSVPASRGADDAVLRLAEEGNQAAIGSIRSASCRFAQELVSGPPRSFLCDPGHYWRQGDVTRVLLQVRREGTPDYDSDCLLRNGRIWHVNTWSGGGAPERALDVGATPFLQTDVWQFALLTHWGKAEFRHYTFSELLRRPGAQVRQADRADKDLHVRLDASGGEHEFWFDPKANYLVRKSVWVPADDRSVRREQEVTQFAEPAPGVFFPTVIESRFIEKGKPVVHTRVRLSDLQVNKPLPANALRLPNIAGMPCTDRVRKVKYTVDADGNRVGPESPSDATVGVLQLAEAPLRAPFPPSRPPSWPAWLWVVACAVGVLVVAAVLRRRSRAGAAWPAGETA